MMRMLVIFYSGGTAGAIQLRSWSLREKRSAKSSTNTWLNGDSEENLFVMQDVRFGSTF